MTDASNFNTTLQPLWPNWYMILCYWLNVIMWTWVIMAEFLLRLPMSVSTAQRIVHHRLGLRIVLFILASSCIIFHFIPPLQPSVFFYISCVPLVLVIYWGVGDIFALDLKAKARIVEQHLLAESRMDSAIESATFNRRLAPYYFMRASTVLSWGRASSPPRFQDLQKRGLLDCVTIDILSAYQNGVEDTLFISHRWEDASVPDGQAAQLKVIQAHLQAHPSIKYVWYDYWCMPQRRTDGVDDRTPAQLAEFHRMLQGIADLYLTMRVLIIVDMTYLGRFWTTLEAYCAVQKATPAGLRPCSDDEGKRYHIECIHNAPPAMKFILHDMVANKSLEQMVEMLARPDITVTNAKDKEKMLPVLLATAEHVKEMYKASAEEAYVEAEANFEEAIMVVQSTIGGTDAGKGKGWPDALHHMFPTR